ncbi:MAG: protein kinase [Gemmatimonadota bacterium]
MFCSRCGTKLDDSAKLCTNCGLDLAPTTPVKAIAGGEVTERDIVREALAEDFEILEELGRGGMAIVFRARDLHLDREVAVKVLPFSLAFDTEFVERFQREARTAAGLEHPNITPIYRVGKAGRVTYFVMKYLRGQSLSHLLARRGHLSPPEIRRLLIEAGQAIGYAASRGIVHRDIKPDNIMFDEHGLCMLADFGIAKAASGQRLTGTGMSIGTPHYMSPEQARAQNTDGRSDIYSLGIVAYQCLVGKVPYDGEDSFAIGYKHIMEPIPIPDLATTDERRLFDVVRRMIMKDPNDRFQTCEAMIAQLEGELVAAAGTMRGSGVNAAPRSPSQPTSAITQPSGEGRATLARPITHGGKRPVARRSDPGTRGVLWGMVALLAIVGGGAAYYFLARRPDASPPGSAVFDSAPALTSAIRGLADSTAMSDSSPRLESVPDSSVNSAPPVRDSTAPAVGPGPVDSGGIRLTGLPRRTRVMIDEVAVAGATIRLAPGPHVLAISAPRFQFYTDTVDVAPGTVLDLVPNLVPLSGVPTLTRGQRRAGEPVPAVSCDEPGPTYNADRSCFDQRPRPAKPPFVPLTSGIEGTPRSSVLLIKVSADGKSLEVRPFNPSNDATFERLARQYAESMEWRPATKNGVAVIGWTQMAFPPQQP